MWMKCENIIKKKKLGICDKKGKVSLVISLERNSSYIFLSNVNFKKINIRLYFLIISSMLVKFQEDYRLLAMLLIKYLNFKFL